MAKKKKQEEKEIIEKIFGQSLDELMGDCYAIYAKEVIQDRAIPDARDGMKPVQRRIIFDMWKTGNTIDKPTKKCAHIVGDVMGKYHPHGDSSIYEALVHMAQPWALRIPLIDFQGNKGSIDGDGPAAFRYTEARLAAIANEMVKGIDEDTVDFELTFDDDSKEPTVLPARIPNLLLNGSEGIAVGIATSIPPHNLKELILAIIHRIKHPNCTVEDLMQFVKGPDFPTGGIIYANEGLESIYKTGNGRVNVASKTEITTNEEGVKQIIITEIPYRVNKSVLVKAIDKIRHDKSIPGIDEVRDETDREGIRIAIDLKDEAKPEVILNYLMQKTPLMSGYSANMVAIVDGRPKTLDLVSYCDCYIAHQMDVITRRSRYRLSKCEARLEIVDGLIKSISILDEIIKVIRASENKADAKINLQRRFGFTENQSEAIAMMPLYKLSHTDVNTLLEEKKTLEDERNYLLGLLNDQSGIKGVIVDDLKEISKKYGDERRTEIRTDTIDFSIDKRDLIASEDVYLAITRDGYAKRSSLKSWKGSKGHAGAKPGIKSTDSIIYNGQANTTDFLLVFTSKGNYLYIPVNEIKENKWNEEGYHLSSLVKLSPEEKVVKVIVVSKFRNDLNIVLLSERGFIKRIVLSQFPVARRKKPIAAIRMSGGDSLVDATYTSGNSNLFVINEDGLASFYNENDVNITNPGSGGLKAGSFKGKKMVGVLAFNPDERDKVLMITDRCHTRVFDINKMNVGGRLTQGTLLFSQFKSEPHKLIFVAKVGNKEAPFTYDAVMENGERHDVTFEDFFLTPMEKYAKRDSEFPAKARLAFISREDSDKIDDKIKAFEPPVREEPVVMQPLREDKEEEPAPTSFEQISLFDDLDEEE